MTMSGDCFGKVEPIDRNEAIRRFEHMRELTADQVVEMLKRVPSCRHKGHWIDMADFEQCSECRGTHLKEVDTYYGKATWIKTDFCPNCGADMRDDADDDSDDDDDWYDDWESDRDRGREE